MKLFEKIIVICIVLLIAISSLNGCGCSSETEEIKKKLEATEQGKKAAEEEKIKAEAKSEKAEKDKNFMVNVTWFAVILVIISFFTGIAIGSKAKKDSVQLIISDNVDVDNNDRDNKIQ